MAIKYHKWNIIIPTMECQEFFNPTCEKIYIFQIVTTIFIFIQWFFKIRLRIKKAPPIHPPPPEVTAERFLF